MTRNGYKAADEQLLQRQREKRVMTSHRLSRDMSSARVAVETDRHTSELTESVARQTSALDIITALQT